MSSGLTESQIVSRQSSTRNDTLNKNEESPAAMWGIFYFYAMKHLLTLSLLLASLTVMGQTECEKRLSLQEAEIQRMNDSLIIIEHKIRLLKKENETLRSIMKGYIVQIDSLNTELMRMKEGKKEE